MVQRMRTSSKDVIWQPTKSLQEATSGESSWLVLCDSVFLFFFYHKVCESMEVQHSDQRFPESFRWTLVLFCNRQALDSDTNEGIVLSWSRAARVTCCVRLALNWDAFDLIYHLTRFEVLFHVVSDGYWTPAVHQLLGARAVRSSTFLHRCQTIEH